LAPLFLYRNLWPYVEGGGKSEYFITANSVRRLSWALFRGLTIFENGNNNNNTKHFNICKEIEVRVKTDNKYWYDHVPKSVETSHEGKITILWNQKVRTDSTIANNKPDIIMCDNNKGTSMFIFAAFP
jgi:hypothetical protein